MASPGEKTVETFADQEEIQSQLEVLKGEFVTRTPELQSLTLDEVHQEILDFFDAVQEKRRAATEKQQKVGHTLSLLISTTDGCLVRHKKNKRQLS